MNDMMDMGAMINIRDMGAMAVGLLGQWETVGTWGSGRQ